MQVCPVSVSMRHVRLPCRYTWNRPDPANTRPLGGFGLMVSAVGPAADCEGAAAGAPPCPCGGSGVWLVEDGAVALGFAGGYTIGGVGCVGAGAAALRSLGSGKTSPVAMARF
jgi:hypothetical protein